jgi:hypothetical protein
VAAGKGSNKCAGAQETGREAKIQGFAGSNKHMDPAEHKGATAVIRRLAAEASPEAGIVANHEDGVSYY